MADENEILVAEISALIKKAATKGLTDGMRDAAHNTTTAQYVKVFSTGRPDGLKQDAASVAARLSAGRRYLHSNERAHMYSVQGRMAAGKIDEETTVAQERADIRINAARSVISSFTARPRVAGETARTRSAALRREVYAALPAVEQGMDEIGERSARPQIRQMLSEASAQLSAGEQSDKLAQRARRKSIASGETLLSGQERTEWLNRRFGGAAQFTGIAPGTLRTGAGMGQILGGIASGRPLAAAFAGASGAATLGASGRMALGTAAAVAAAAAGAISIGAGSTFDPAAPTSADSHLREIAGNLHGHGFADPNSTPVSRLFDTWRNDAGGLARMIRGSGLTPEQGIPFIQAAAARGTGHLDTFDASGRPQPNNRVMQAIRAQAYGVSPTTTASMNSSMWSGTLGGSSVNDFGTIRGPAWRHKATEFMGMVQGLGETGASYGMPSLDPVQMIYNQRGLKGFSPVQQNRILDWGANTRGKVASGQGLGSPQLSLLGLHAFGNLDISKSFGGAEIWQASKRVESGDISDVTAAQSIMRQMSYLPEGLRGPMTQQMLNALGLPSAPSFLQTLQNANGEYDLGNAANMQANRDMMDVNRAKTDLLDDKAVSTGTALGNAYAGSGATASVTRVAEDLRMSLRGLAQAVTRWAQFVESQPGLR